MHAVVGDRLHVRGNAVGHPDRTGEIVEVRDSGGAPPYLVRFDDGRTCLILPGSRRGRRASAEEDQGGTQEEGGQGLAGGRRTGLTSRWE